MTRSSEMASYMTPEIQSIPNEIINQYMEDASLVQAIIAMGHSLNLKLIAEGVENGSHEIFLNAHGCEYAQGFYYSKPVPADEIEKIFIDKNKERRKDIKLVSK